MPENSKQTEKENRVEMKDSKAGIIGDRATVHGGIHIISIENVTVFRTVDDTTGEKEPDKKKIDIGPNPYISLNAFQERDADRFFGREKLTEKLWKKLRDLIEPGVEEDKIRFLPILGPSGSGKSSVARAGLISELAKKPLPGYKKARVAVFTPGNMPLYSMAGVLAGIVSGEASPLAKADEFHEGLKKQNDKGEFDGLTRIAHIFPDIHFSPLIILVDQFEEIYSSRCEAKERNCFIGNLLHAASDAAGYVSVIITLRSDFLSETQSHRMLNRAIAENGEIVSVMDIEELRRAISKPAEKAGHPLDPLVVDMLIEQTKDREGALPLLQFALTQIWEGMAEGEAPAERLKKIGGVGGALAKEAHRLFSKLNPDDRLIVRRAFLAMVNLGEGVKDTRRRVRLENIVGGNEKTSHVKKVLETFSNRSSRLVTFFGGEVEERSISVEITHEIMLEQWEDLKDWLSHGRDELRLQRRLEQAAEHWKKENGSLWRSHDLYQARKLYEKRKDDFTALQQEFFLASRRAANRRWFFGIILTALILSGVVAGFILINKEKRVAQETILMSNYHLALAYEEKAGTYLRPALSGEKPDENFQKAWLYTLAALNMDIPADKDLPLSKKRLGIKEMDLGLLRGADIDSHQKYQGFATEDKTIREWESDLLRTYEEKGNMAPEFKAVYRCSFDLFPFEMDGISLVSIPKDPSESKPWYADYPRLPRKDPVQWMVEAFAKAAHDGKISHEDISRAWIDSRAEAVSGIALSRLEQKSFTNDVGMTFVYIQPGTFFMGSPLEESGRLDGETFHLVTLNKGFYMQTTEVTQEQWEAVMGNHDPPSYFKDCGKDCPVENVSWDDTQKFIKKLNDMEGANIYRLPTEAEWEYAARAGTTTAFSFGGDAGRLSEYAWYSENSGRKTHPVGKLKPNAWGLYDMHGNVWEWCEDQWHDNYKGAPVDGSAWVDRHEGADRVVRGGSWNFNARNCPCANRFRDAPDGRSHFIGFRLVRLPGQPGEPGY